MNVVVFSGTTEGRELSRRLAALGIEVTVSVATRWGRKSRGAPPASPSGADGSCPMRWPLS